MFICLYGLRFIFPIGDYPAGCFGNLAVPRQPALAAIKKTEDLQRDWLTEKWFASSFPLTNTHITGMKTSKTSL